MERVFCLIRLNLADYLESKVCDQLFVIIPSQPSTWRLWGVRGAVSFQRRLGGKKWTFDQEAESTWVRREPTGVYEVNTVEEKWLTHMWGEDFTTSIHISWLKLSSYVMF